VTVPDQATASWTVVFATLDTLCSHWRGSWYAPSPLTCPLPFSATTPSLRLSHYWKSLIHVTVQVDNLHPKASSLLLNTFPPSSNPYLRPPSFPKILELHGTLAKVHCMNHYHEQPRDDYQEELASENEVWDDEAKAAEREGRRPRTNPDGDVSCSLGDNSWVLM
jgi:NAD-dependent deacetylase sirtuin 4